MSEQQSSSGSAEAIILVKAAPQVGLKNGETVCCAGLSPDGTWLRLYPVKFRNLEDAQKFRRWDRVRFRWRLPRGDSRPESRSVDQQTLEIVGRLSEREQSAFVKRSIVTSLAREREAQRTLALIKPEVLRFEIERKSESAFAAEKNKFVHVQRQSDLFVRQIAAYRPCPFMFRYVYRIEDGERTSTCQDWELEAAFYNRSRDYGEEKALDFIQKTFGEDYPAKGMLFAMGTHSQYPDTWLMNGIIRYKEDAQGALF